MNNIAQKTTDVQMAGTISCFVKRYRTGELLKACNAYKEKGITAVRLFIYMLQITLSGPDFATESFEVQISENGDASVNLTLTEKGSALINVENARNTDLTLMAYNNGSLAYTTTERGTGFHTPQLESGYYTFIVMEASSFVDAAESQWDLPYVDYASVDSYISDGEIVELSVDEVPQMDDSSLYATDPERTVFKSTRTNVSLGKSFSISASAAMLDATATDFKWVFEIPSGCSYMDHSRTLDGRSLDDAEAIEGNTLTVPVDDPSQTVRLILMPLKSGVQTVKGWL